MSVLGAIRIAVSFDDTTSRATKVVSKQIRLIEQSEGLTGKIAIVSGTVGTASVTVTPKYRNALGTLVTFPDRGDSRAGYDRIAIKTNSTNDVQLTSANRKTVSRAGSVGITETPQGEGSFSVQTLGGTADYLVLVYADGD